MKADTYNVKGTLVAAGTQGAWGRSESPREHFTKNVTSELALQRMSRSLSDHREGRKGIQGMKKNLSQSSKL